MRIADRDSLMDLIVGEKDNKKLFQAIIEPDEAWIMSLVPRTAPKQTYEDFQALVSEYVGTSPSDVVVVGSSKVGFSMSPRKDFRDFDPELSDIDVAIVSEKIFDQFWGELLTLFYSPECYVNDQFQRDVFLRFLNIERNKSLPSIALREWHKKIDRLKRDVFTGFGLPMAIKFRIYRDLRPDYDPVLGRVSAS